MAEQELFTPPHSNPSASNGKREAGLIELKTKISVKNLNFYYGKNQALLNNAIDIPEKQVTAVIGPSGCGKSTHLRVYNRIYELYRGSTRRRGG